MPPNVACVNLLVCEKVLSEEDNVISAIRIADVFLAPVDADISAAKQAIKVNVFGQIKMADTDQTEHTLELRLVRPNGESEVVGPPTSGPAKTVLPKFPGGYIIVGQIAVTPTQHGLHHFRLTMDGDEIARCPFILLKDASEMAR